MSAPRSERRRPTVVLVASRTSVPGFEAALRANRVRPIRLAVIEPRPVAPSRWLPKLRAGPAPDTVIVTGRPAVAAAVRPWRRAVGASAAKAEYWAVGPGTASELHREGVRRVRRADEVGADALVAALDRAPPRTVVYFRSDRAGPQLGRRLRQRRHRVADPVVYRVVRSAAMSARRRADLARADVVVITSPSAVQELERRLDRTAFKRFARETRVVVLGRRSLQAVRAAGVRTASVAPSTSAQRLTRHLLGEIRRARA